ncbi:MAG: hypothetical protein ACREN5_14890 [Gemmatimonadales bacterium]
MTDLCSFGACRLGGLVAICWSPLLWLRDAVGLMPEFSGRAGQCPATPYRSPLQLLVMRQRANSSGVTDILAEYDPHTIDILHAKLANTIWLIFWFGERLRHPD